MSDPNILPSDLTQRLAEIGWSKPVFSKNLNRWIFGNGEYGCDIDISGNHPSTGKGFNIYSLYAIYRKDKLVKACNYTAETDWILNQLTSIE